MWLVVSPGLEFVLDLSLVLGGNDMRSMYLLCCCLLALSGCTFYEINVNVLSPEKTGDSPLTVHIDIHDNNDADTTETNPDVSTI